MSHPDDYYDDCGDGWWPEPGQAEADRAEDAWTEDYLRYLDETETP